MIRSVILSLCLCWQVASPVYATTFDWEKVESLIDNIENENKNISELYKQSEMNLIIANEQIMQLEKQQQDNLQALENCEKQLEQSERATKIWKYISITSMGILGGMIIYNQVK